MVEWSIAAFRAAESVDSIVIAAPPGHVEELAGGGVGVIAGGSMRSVLELAGIHDILTKCLGTTNPINVVMATVEALRSLKTAEKVAALRGKTVKDIFAA